MNREIVAGQPANEKLYQYKLSDAAQLRAMPDGSLVVKHLLSGRSYKFGSMESSVIFALESGCGFDRASIEHIDDQFISSMLRFLQDKNLVVACDATIEDSYLLIEPDAPIWGQFATFAACQRNDVCYVGVPYGYGNGTSSAAKEAPLALRNWLRTHRLSKKNILNEPHIANYFPSGLEHRAKHLQSLHQQDRVKDLGDLYIYPYESPNAIFARLEKLAADMAREGIVPIFIGGDHAITCPILKGMNSQLEEFCVLHFDAHNDCYQTAVDSLFATTANNHHGNFLSRALAECEGIRHAYQWGVRGINNLGAILPSRVTSHNTAELIMMLETGGLNTIPDDLAIYVTIDIDVIDPSIAPGTGSPVPGGIGWGQLFLALEQLLKNKRVIGIDIVELDPGADIRGVTTQGASHLLSLLPGFVET
jgi:agmatinase